MEFKEDVAPVFTQDTYYDLFDGGYIKPHELLKSSVDVARVENAIKLIEQFLREAEEKGLLEIG